MSPPKHSQPSAHWAAALQQARTELELLSGETFTLPGAPKQDAPPLTTSSSTAPDEIPWSVVVKKKGKKGKRKGKKKVSTGPSPAKSPSHSICGSFKESVTWHTREVMKARTEWKHKKQRVYTYTSLPKDFQIYQDTKTLSKAEKRRIISGHRFHPQHELETIPEDSKLSLTKPRLPRVNPIPHQRQGPVPVDLGESAPTPTKSLWSQVAAKPAVPAVPKVPVKPAVPKVPPPVKPSFTKVSVKPPVTKPAVPEQALAEKNATATAHNDVIKSLKEEVKQAEIAREVTEQTMTSRVASLEAELRQVKEESATEIPAKTPVTLKKRSQILDRPATKVSPGEVSAATPKLPKPPVDSTLRRQGSVPVNIEESAPIPTKTLSWSQVAAKPPAVPKVVVSQR